MVICHLKVHGLVVNETKCVFCVSSLIFSGHKVSEDGIAPSEEKVKTISTTNHNQRTTAILGDVPILRKVCETLIPMVTTLARFRELNSKESILSLDYRIDKLFYSEQNCLITCNTTGFS